MKKIIITLFLSVLIFLSCYLIFHRQKSIDTYAVPWHDGSHHFSLNANLYIQTAEGDFSAFKKILTSTPELFLPYFVYSSFFYLLGKISYQVLTIIYILSYLLIVASFYYSSKENYRVEKTFLFVSFLCLSQLLFSKQGGLFDTRIDVFSAIVGSMSLIFLFNQRIFISILLFFVASLLKGAGFFLLAPIIFVLISLFFIQKKIGIRFSIRFLFQVLICFVLLIFFIKFIFVSALSYNLMQTGGGNAYDRLIIYIQNVVSYLDSGKFFYFNALNKYSFANLIVLILFSFSIYSLIRKKWKLFFEKIIFLGIFVFTYVLLTSNPLKSEVLIIWFLPALLLIFCLLIENVKVYLNKISVLSIIFFLSLYSLFSLERNYKFTEVYYESAAKEILLQAKELSSIIEKKYANRKINGIVFVNYLSSHGDINHNYDVYTNIIQKNLLSIKLVLFGWELSTFSPDWKKEIQSYRNNELIIFVLQEDSLGIPIPNVPNINGKVNRNIILDYKKKNPECFIEVNKKILIPHMGERVIYLLEENEFCKKIIFE